MSATVLIFLAATALVAGAGIKDDSPENCEQLMELSQGERTISVHVFNLTNPEDFLNASLPFPHVGEFQEIPFPVREIQMRNNCRVVDDSHVSFEKFREILMESPPWALDVPINTANIPFSLIGLFLQKVDLAAAPFKLAEFKGEGYLTPIGSTASNLLQNGYDTSLISTFLQDKYPKNITELQKDNFSPFNELLHPKDFTVRTDAANFGDISQLDGQETGKSSCNPAVGTEGYFFKPNVTKDTILHFYSEDICSVIPIVFETNTIYDGIPAVKFVFSEDVMKKAACDCEEVNEEYPDDVKACFPDGAVDVKTCQNNLPYVVSLPHFLKADAKYRENITGMAPRDLLHKSYFIIEPITGLVLESSLKFQWNVNLRKLLDQVESSWSDDEVTIQDTIFPMFWTDKKFMLAKEKVMSLLEETKTTEKPSTTTPVPTTVKVTESTAPKTTVATTKAPTNFKPEQMQADINQLYKDMRTFMYITWSFLGLLFIAFAASWFYYLKHYKRILQAQNVQVMYPAKM